MGGAAYSRRPRRPLACGAVVFLCSSSLSMDLPFASLPFQHCRGMRLSSPVSAAHHTHAPPAYKPGLALAPVGHNYRRSYCNGRV
ncbi:MAG: hypothetical protein J3K34DRAFT_412519 [Monoraphidium minutum]|nr:MAG: hypothetical protein J3K34DRAFT_412519 [Monoraphidium minutum]